MLRSSAIGNASFFRESSPVADYPMLKSHKLNSLNWTDGSMDQVLQLGIVFYVLKRSNILNDVRLSDL
jgi:hypothetical protein